MMRKLYLILFAFLVVCCMRHKSPHPTFKAIDNSEGLFAINYNFVDVPSEQRIEISFYNNLDTGVCLDPGNWPNKAGKIDYADKYVFLVVGSHRFPIEKFNTGYCPGCAQYVAPGETIRASIPYEAFNLPDTLYNEKKHLEFTPKAYRCKKRD